MNENEEMIDYPILNVDSDYSIGSGFNTLDNSDYM